MRGPALASTCPRCGTEAPPTDEPLAHCLTCKLAYDPKAEPIERPPRAPREDRALVQAPRGITITREPGEVTIRWSYQRAQGLLWLVIGVLCASVVLGNLDTPGEDWKHLVLLGAAAVFSLYAGAMLAFGEQVLRIDERQLLVRREPLRLTAGTWIGRHEIQDLELRRPTGSGAFHELVAVTPRGPIRLGLFARGQLDAASCIQGVIREALADIEPA